MRPPILNPLFAETTTLNGIGPKLAALIGRVSGPLVIDLLFLRPISFIDRRCRPKIAAAPLGQIVTLDVEIRSHDRSERLRQPYRVTCCDDSGIITLTFFNARREIIERSLPIGARRLISGRIEAYAGALQMAHPDLIVDPERQHVLPLIEPVYPLAAGLTNSIMRRAILAASMRAPALPEWLDPAFKRAQNWPSWREALLNLHAPQSPADLDSSAPARRRLAYDELLANQLALALMRVSHATFTGRPLRGSGQALGAIRTALPFELTADQETALAQILSDINAQPRMHRLLQGDVGSGKTIVAFLSMAAAAEAGAQAALMAPTEILARQHFEFLQPLADRAGLRLDILTGQDKRTARDAKLACLKSGRTQIILGTHALLHEAIEFLDLGLVVIDEQHRFGVHQRLNLAKKGGRSHLLVMTATPIPRTLQMTAYGDLSVSVLRDKPPGRRPVVTRAIPLDRLDEVISAVRRAADAGEQIYWVCPRIDDAGDEPFTAAETRFEAMRKPLGDRVGLIHGRLSQKDKDRTMDRFHRREISLLIATTVIEVGVNAPNATVMVIENAERFGLAQLHQLRGRVGRGSKQSACLLLYRPPLSEAAAARLRIIRDTDDGFLIAEEDLRLRGPGEALGAAQSGQPDYRFADLSTDQDLLAAADDDARLILRDGSRLAGPRGEAVRNLLYLFRRDDAIRMIRSG